MLFFIENVIQDFNERIKKFNDETLVLLKMSMLLDPKFSFNKHFFDENEWLRIVESLKNFIKNETIDYNTEYDEMSNNAVELDDLWEAPKKRKTDNPIDVSFILKFNVLQVLFRLN